MNSQWLKEGERLDDLMRCGMQIIQHPKLFRFGTDAVLLSDFAAVHKESICDLGTGCGILPLLLCARSEQVQIDAIEIQPALCDMASRSVQLNCLQERIRIHQADICHLEDVFPAATFDCIVCNPPYGKKGQGQPNMAEEVRIARHETLCTLPDICKSAARLLKNSGRLCMIHQSGRIADVLSAMRENGLEPKRLRSIHYQADQPAKLFLIEARRLGGIGLIWMPPLILRDAQGNETEELRKIYGYL